ncbi:SET and MYND domain-containing protein 4 [Anopheles cruzii]|uniref:SET and MYND domain-containing protein 4 n=1 Tax=Anopheles cruzii TaxID=68878 RepID=UPI0022EC5C7B|nr:SET and MYND domain-containing protein 4 [Anopheles cruzii]
MCTSLEEPFGAWELLEELWPEITAKDPTGPSMAPPAGETTRVMEFLEQELQDAWENPNVRERLKLRPDMKDTRTANDTRSKGNDLFHPKVKRYIEAIKWYNESLCFSESGSEERALAYANRSAACYELHRYGECLENIRLARASNYPARLMEKLLKREQAAKQALQCNDVNNNLKNDKDDTRRNQKQPHSLTLTYDANRTVPQVANCLELTQSDQFGRYVVTNRDLKAGDVVAIEKPTHTLLLDKFRHMRCDFCHHERPYTLIPCEGCTVAMYCSSECLGAALRSYHGYECPILRDLWRMFTKIPVMAMRTVTTAIVSFDRNLDEMRLHLDALDLDGADVNAFALDWRTASPRDIYNTVHTLDTNERRRGKKDLAQRIFFALFMRDLLVERTVLGPVCEQHPEHSQLLYKLLLRHVQTTPTNMHSLYYMNYDPDTEEFNPANYASACFPLLSMLNHSCAPNLSRVTLPDASCGVLVVRPIPKGGQLFDNYGKHHCLDDLTSRREELAKQYKFCCRCEACENNYGRLSKLPRVDVLQFGAIDTYGIHAKLVRHQPKVAAELLPKLVGYLNNLGCQYPRYELSATQELFLRAFEILHKESSDLVHDLQYCKP